MPARHKRHLPLTLHADDTEPPRLLGIAPPPLGSVRLRAPCLKSQRDALQRGNGRSLQLRQRANVKGVQRRRLPT